MTADINSVDLEDGFEVLIYGHEHTPESLNEEENVIESLMENYDHLALEH
jgi:predicted phosphodiesterase